MKKKVAIKPNGIADRILTTVISAGEIKRYKIRPFLTDVSTNGYYKAYHQLLVLEYIKEDAHTWKGYGRTGGKSVYVSATLKGRSAFAELYGQEYLVKISPNISKKRNFDRQSKTMDVNALFSVCDMAYAQGEKPTIAEFLSLECGEEYAAMAIRHGIAYSSVEIKDYLRNQHFVTGSNIPYDSASGSRFFSLLFYKGRAYVIYNTGARAMLWASVTEHRMKAVLCKMINDAPLSQMRVFQRQTDASLVCIVICSRKIGLMNVISGKGYRPMGKSQDIQRKSMTIQGLLKDYSTAALIPLCGNRKEQFMNALEMQDSKEQGDYADRLTTLYPGLTYVKSGVGMCFADGMDTICFALPFLNLNWMQAYRGAKKPAYFIVPKTTQESISRFMGPLALGFFDVETMQPLYARQYDKDGNVIKTTRT